MADKYSALWWNEQAQATKLSKPTIEALTGMVFRTTWNTNGTVVRFWYKDAIDRAPGFSSSGLLLSGMAPVGFSVESAVGDASYPSWSYFVSPVGYVAPGANAEYNPELSPIYTPPPTISGSIPPGPTDNVFPAPTTIPIDPDVTVLSPDPATGGQASVGSPIPQLLPLSIAAPTAGIRKDQNNMLWWLVAAAVVLYLIWE